MLVRKLSKGKMLQFTTKAGEVIRVAINAKSPAAKSVISLVLEVPASVKLEQVDNPTAKGVTT